MKGERWTTESLVQWMRREVTRQPWGPELEYHPYIRGLVAEHALSGDESFVPILLRDLYWRVIHGHMTDGDRAVVAMVIARILESDDAQKVVCGTPKRSGQHRRGWPGLKISLHVVRVLRQEGTVSKAWERVGEEYHLTASAVKQHWMKWKPKILEGAEETIRGMGANLSDADIKAAAKVSVLGESAARPEEVRAFRRLVKQLPAMIGGQSSGP